MHVFYFRSVDKGSSEDVAHQKRPHPGLNHQRRSLHADYEIHSLILWLFVFQFGEKGPYMLYIYIPWRF